MTLNQSLFGGFKLANIETLVFSNNLEKHYEAKNSNLTESHFYGMSQVAAQEVTLKSSSVLILV